MWLPEGMTHIDLKLLYLVWSFFRFFGKSLGRQNILIILSYFTILKIILLIIQYYFIIYSEF